MFPKVKWRKYGRYSGPLIHGIKKVGLPTDTVNDHFNRAVWLTTQVEGGGKYGTIAGYDGCGISAGLIHTVSVYRQELLREDFNPRNDQGALWELLKEIRLKNPSLLRELDSKFRKIGWETREDGKVCYTLRPDKLVAGRQIREHLTPNAGRVPKHGLLWTLAKNWALIFHNIFSHSSTWETQRWFAAEYYFRKAFYRRAWVVEGRRISSTSMPERWERNNPMDLAMSFFYSNFTNAPGIAYKAIWSVIDKMPRTIQTLNEDNLNHTILAGAIIKALGTYEYGNWRKRYKRTRKAAIKLWPKEFFHKYSIMPKKFL